MIEPVASIVKSFPAIIPSLTNISSVALILISLSASTLPIVAGSIRPRFTLPFSPSASSALAVALISPPAFTVTSSSGVPISPALAIKSISLPASIAG